MGCCTAHLPSDPLPHAGPLPQCPSEYFLIPRITEHKPEQHAQRVHVSRRVAHVAGAYDLNRRESAGPTFAEEETGSPRTLGTWTRDGTNLSFR
jgi:hypothetical protein